MQELCQKKQPGGYCQIRLLSRTSSLAQPCFLFHNPLFKPGQSQVNKYLINGGSMSGFLQEQHKAGSLKLQQMSSNRRISQGNICMLPNSNIDMQFSHSTSSKMAKQSNNKSNKTQYSTIFNKNTDGKVKGLSDKYFGSTLLMRSKFNSRLDTSLKMSTDQHNQLFQAKQRAK